METSGSYRREDHDYWEGLGKPPGVQPWMGKAKGEKILEGLEAIEANAHSDP